MKQILKTFSLYLMKIAKLNSDNQFIDVPLTETNIQMSDKSIDNLNEESNLEKNSENHLNDETINSNLETELNLSQYLSQKLLRISLNLGLICLHNHYLSSIQENHTMEQIEVLIKNSLFTNHKT
jgi:hypothetical protein